MPDSRILFVDTAITHRFYRSEPETAECQPHLCRLAALRWPENSAWCEMVKPNSNWAWSPDGIVGHRVHPAVAAEQGKPMREVITALRTDLGNTGHVVAWNLTFHWEVLRKSCLDLSIPIVTLLPEGVRWHCAMRQTKHLVEKRSKRPWPRMVDVYRHYTGHDLELPPEPIERGKATVQAVRAIWEGIKQEKSQS